MDITNNENPIEKDNVKDALDFILSNSFKSGFGTLSKTELDLIMFTAILKYSDQKNLSDHALSKYLQITQQRIRNLKEKASVKYLMLSRKDAIDKFVEKSSHAKIEEKYLDIPINDVAVKNEIEGILDEQNILLHYQLNPKIFRIRIDDFLELAILFELALAPDKKNKNEIENRIIKEIKKIAAKDQAVAQKLMPEGKGIAELTSSALKEALVKTGCSFGIDLLVSLIPGGAFLSAPAKKLLETIKGKI